MKTDPSREAVLAMSQNTLEAQPLSGLMRCAEAIGADTVGCENRVDLILRIMERQATWRRRLAS